MPITPAQAAKKSTALSDGLVKAHEEIFDDALAATYTAGARVIVQGSICPSIPMHVRQKVVRALKSRYAEAGWSLERKDDQREGAWWEIRARVQGNPRDGGYGGYGSLDQDALNEHGR